MSDFTCDVMDTSQKDEEPRFCGNLKIGFIGFGLIGGSIARALKKMNQNFDLFAYDYHKDHPSADLQAALSDRVLNHITNTLATDFSDCNIVFLCAPVLSNISYLKQLKPIIDPNCILTDVGSVKGNIHSAIEELGLEAQFIGGHPMTGSEKTGYGNSYALLLENAYYILTPTKKTPQVMTNMMLELIRQMGSIPILLDFKEHDEITAAISHLPHIIAAQLVNLVRGTDEKSQKMKNLAAGGFKDITRIASSSPVMWQNICLTNASCIRDLLRQYIASLEEVWHALNEKDEDFLYRMFHTAGEYRNSIPQKAPGLMDTVYEIYLDIVDETGAIASIATLLAKHRISIRNIGIIHNREFEEGVLRIEFYNAQAQEAARTLLQKCSYRIYER
jgi:prephenate dehydrogenase